MHTNLLTSLSQGLTCSHLHEVTFLEAKLSGGDKLLFGCFYRSPTSSEVNNKLLTDFICSVSMPKSYSHICFVGDFHLGGINWSLDVASQSEEGVESIFLEAVRFQHVMSVTRMW